MLGFFSSELGLSNISTLGLCVSAGDEEIEFGTIEELMFHECGHLTVDPVFAADETLQYKWACAICADGNFISEYAQTLTQAEDIAESLVPWYAYATRYPSSHLPYSCYCKTLLNRRPS